MRITLFFLLLSLTLQLVTAQVVTTNPAIPTQDNSVTITFSADKGSGGLKDFTGDVYAHTGVITDKSTGDSNWLYVKATWTQNKAECKMTRVSANVYTLTISPSIREFYGVPAGEKIEKLAFVFRNSDGTKTGKETGDKDIFAQVYDPVLAVAFSKPAKNFFYANPGESIDIEANAAFNETMELYLNNDQVTSITGQKLVYSLTAPQSGTHRISVIARGSGSSVTSEAFFVVKTPTVVEPIPITDFRRGFNRISNSEGLLVLFAPYKSTVYVAGDFNDWHPDQAFQMKKQGDYFWLSIKNLDNKKEYAYQYWIDNDVRVADPYTNKVLDPWNDQYIPSTVYPDLLPYPTGQTENLVSVLTTAQNEYNWQISNFKAPSKEKLVIYELLIRDFTANKDIKTVTDTLGYLKRLGVNAIELMPFNEFEGNDSWGYNPSLYFATDKAYGTMESYKSFIDECHKNGIAVIMDMVLNHSYGQSPLAQMYLDGGKPSTINPWYNREHNMKNPDAQWGYDFNHESTHTQALVDSICSYWMSEFRIDGFRFDFTKGFTNTPYPATSGDTWASSYDAARIRILKRMSNEIWKRKQDAIVIFEHLSDNAEEAELANHGIMLWGNMVHNFNQATMGYQESSDLAWAAYTSRAGWTKPNLVTYMESHDEERLMYKNIMYGKTEGDYSTTDQSTALRRMEAAAALFFAIPGPKMVWQFGERGYDVSIDNNGRTGQKPPKWDYMKDANRKHLYDVYSNMIELKKTVPAFSTNTFTMETSGLVKRIALNHADGDIRVIANFDTKANYIKPLFSQTGWWYDHFRGDSIMVTDKEMTLYSLPGAYHLFSQKKLTGFNVITGIDDQPEAGLKESLNIYPNPATNIVNVTTGGNSSKTIRIISLSGSTIVEKQTEQQSEQIAIDRLRPGVYLVTVEQSGKPLLWKKLIKR